MLNRWQEVVVKCSIVCQRHLSVGSCRILCCCCCCRCCKVCYLCLLLLIHIRTRWYITDKSIIYNQSFYRCNNTTTVTEINNERKKLQQLKHHQIVVVADDDDDDVTLKPTNWKFLGQQKKKSQNWANEWRMGEKDSIRPALDSVIYFSRRNDWNFRRSYFHFLCRSPLPPPPLFVFPLLACFFAFVSVHY